MTHKKKQPTDPTVHYIREVVNRQLMKAMNTNLSVEQRKVADDVAKHLAAAANLMERDAYQRTEG